MEHSTSATNVRANVTRENGETKTGSRRSKARDRRVAAAPGVERHDSGAASTGQKRYLRGQGSDSLNDRQGFCSAAIRRGREEGDGWERVASNSDPRHSARRHEQ